MPKKTKDEQDRFAVFILTHGRPDRVYTETTLRQAGYTGDIYYIVDNEDKTVGEYKTKYGESVIVFDKKWFADQTDEMDNFDDRRTTTHARNAIFKIAADLEIKYFVQLDDDYTAFQFRTDSKGQYPKNVFTVKSTLDKIFSSMLKYFKSTNAKSIAFSQGGDFIGGADGDFATVATLKRKCMNSFFCSTDRPFKFIGRQNEDVNTYVIGGHRGDLFLTVPLVSLTQKATQSNEGAITDAYKQYGTYVKSFYTVMLAPGCAKVSMMHTTHKRIHHTINWKATAPMILRESHASWIK